MHSVEHEVTLTSSADAAWAVVGDIARLATFDAQLKSSAPSDAGGETRLQVADRNGRVWTERCVERRRLGGWTLQADADGLPFPLSALRRTLALREERGDGGAARTVLTYRVEYALRMGPLGALRLPRDAVRARVRQTLDAMVHAIRAQKWRHDATVQSILERKGSDVITLAPGTLVRAAADMLREHRIGAALIIGPEGALLGLVSERDIAYRMAEHGADVLLRPVDDIMSTDLVVCAPEHDMEFVMLCMTERRVRHLPVVRDGRLLGIVSIGDVVRERIAALESESQTMREYIETREWNRLHDAALPPEAAAQP